MAVDANVLIFERIKEELDNKLSYKSAVKEGFDKAWSSIRDSNFSSLITCGILLWFGTSIIQGFAFNLAMGILISMFTAITVTKNLLKVVAKSKLGENLKLFGVNEEGKAERKQIDFIGKRKIGFALSGILIGITLVSLLIFGLKPGLDFTGGTLMETEEGCLPEMVTGGVQESTEEAPQGGASMEQSEG